MSPPPQAPPQPPQPQVSPPHQVPSQPPQAQTPPQPHPAPQSFQAPQPSPGHQPPQPPPPSPYGAYPPSPPPTPPQGPGKGRKGLIAGAVVVALAVIGGGAWFVVGQGDDDPGAPAAKGGPSASASASPSAPDEPDASGETSGVQPPPEETPSDPVLPSPTGTGLQAVWRASDSTMLALGDAYTDEPTRINAVLSDGAGLECKGRWQKDESGDFLEMALLCEQDGVRVPADDRVGNLRQEGDTLSVEWKKGATGTESYERFRDMDPA
ncbi:hypothetical protein CP967_14750 [Streptomyces nitrosporeus]|uniref:Serine/threonine protein kinase n=1 Tax=Streptomyces nitrosporeus TaxID=28894 RepID=A0A5J6FMP0_9ACTN|nr:hypothetical protein CP967_14750 [Streptomyces nitrosporeus]